MKNLAIILFVIVSIVMLIVIIPEHKSTKFTGRIIRKEFVEEHQCHDDVSSYKHDVFNIVVVHPSPVIHHHHHTVNSVWKIWVANIYVTEQFEVSREYYHSHWVGQKVTINQ